MKKILSIFLLAIISFGLFSFIAPNFVKAEDAKINIHFFWGKGCPHCEKEKQFLETIKSKYTDVEVHEYEVWYSQDNLKLLEEVGKELGAQISGVPFTVVGKNYMSGWLDEKTSGAKLESFIACAKEEKCEDVVSKVSKNGSHSNEKAEEKSFDIPDEITLPVFGTIKIADFSLPVLAVIIGILDGFNPCAMWVLIFLISFLIGMRDKKRMWIFGITFIGASAFVYFLFMTAWLNLIMFLGFINWVRIVIGLIALGGGIYNLREYKITKNPTCKVADEGKKQKIVERLKRYTHEKNFWLAIGGLILLAFSVNLIEAVCSAGLPVIFTQILTLSDIPTWKYYLYILVYVFFFMIDDLIVFFIAMLTLQLTGLTSKYTRYSHLIGGLLMLIIGILLIFKPEWLMFG